MPELIRRISGLNTSAQNKPYDIWPYHLTVMRFFLWIRNKSAKKKVASGNLVYLFKLSSPMLWNLWSSLNAAFTYTQRRNKLPAVNFIGNL
jgi:hypothetical protein